VVFLYFRDASTGQKVLSIIHYPLLSIIHHSGETKDSVLAEQI